MVRVGPPHPSCLRARVTAAPMDPVPSASVPAIGSAILAVLLGTGLVTWGAASIYILAQRGLVTGRVWSCAAGKRHWQLACMSQVVCVCTLVMIMVLEGSRSGLLGEVDEAQAEATCYAGAVLNRFTMPFQFFPYFIRLARLLGLYDTRCRRKYPCVMRNWYVANTPKLETGTIFNGLICASRAGHTLQ